MQRIVFCLIVIFSGAAAHKSSSQEQDRFMIRMRLLLDIVDQLKNYMNYLAPDFFAAPQDIKDHCELSAFSCFQKAELKIINAGDNEKMIQTRIHQLRRKLPPTKEGKKQKHKPELECPACDSYEKKPPKEFLERLKSLLQRIIYQHAS
ncbi:PREDICTED: interleukin-21 [Elephantulus edwardii]|uniref:interleukin-21 n=1 Tax=Elephantulus edwardii TaxID=28737 RepID=UPI0003F09246|nr:PREDICTED: interleukin-21 [Elephantulus edwardii]